MKPQILISATNSGCGKTTLTVGLLHALKKKGLDVQPFKCGPDYIDTQYHRQAAGKESINLDTWLSSQEHVRHIYQKYAENSEATVVEGVMGLFDGYDKMHGSCAEMAHLLQIPVVLLINARSAAYSIAPLIYGFKNFQKNITIAGVIFNNVSSASHYKYLQEACKDIDIKSFGFLPHIKELEIPSRHLGLTLDDVSRMENLTEKISGAIDDHIDIPHLLKTCTCQIHLSNNPDTLQQKKGHLRIAIAHDEAFNFVYRENIARLEEIGDITYFSPINDGSLPAADIVYLPGGYPEFHAQELSANLSMRHSLYEYANKGGCMFAECGGMMYLCHSMIDMNSTEHQMVSVFPAIASMKGMRLHLGYRRFKYAGKEWRGHEFHYSSIVEGTNRIKSVTQQFNAKGEPVNTPLYRYKNTIASYTHLYWGESDSFLTMF